jgi:hypothetical protein
MLLKRSSWWALVGSGEPISTLRRLSSLEMIGMPGGRAQLFGQPNLNRR